MNESKTFRINVTENGELYMNLATWDEEWIRLRHMRVYEFNTCGVIRYC